MAVTVTNLIQGPADLFVGQFGATEPPEEEVALPVDETSVATEWRDIGGTQGGVTLEVELEYSELEVDQIVDIPESRLTKRTFKVNTNMAEPTLENLRFAFNGGTINTGAGYKSYSPTMDNSAVSPNYSAAIFDGIAPAGLRRRVIVRKVINEATVEQESVKDGQTLLPVELKAHYVSRSVPPFDYVDEDDGGS
ncbi:hypothetical protein [Actinomadura miaoliensis]|uniref:Phage tail protein n=1 Tax=Actinomadura miaoliensis TaxID=430685 RepID=A0ABP7W8K4_9ACTN